MRGVVETLVFTDASKYALGGWIGQRYEDGIHPVVFCSRKLRPAELNYHTSEQELLALLYVLEKNAHYLRGIEFVINTDHESLKYLQSQEFLSRRQARWILVLQEFSMKIEYLPGKFDNVADYLTRHADVQPLCNLCKKSVIINKIDIFEFTEMLKAALLEDEFANKIMAWRENEEAPVPQAIRLLYRQFRLHNGLLYKGRTLYLPAGPRC